MKRTLKNLTILGTALLFITPLAHGQSSSGTTTLSVTVAAEAALTINTGTTSLTSTGTSFSNYTGATSLTYYIRTGASGGSGNLTLYVSSDFSPAGGPSVGTPPTAGDKLTYTCTVTQPGNNGTATACTGSVTASTSSGTSGSPAEPGTNVVTWSADSRSSINGNGATVNWTLTNDPKYKTGTYSATVTFTIGAI